MTGRIIPVYWHSSFPKCSRLYPTPKGTRFSTNTTTQSCSKTMWHQNMLYINDQNLKKLSQVRTLDAGRDCKTNRFSFFAIILNGVLHTAPYIMNPHESFTMKMSSMVYRCNRIHCCRKGYRQMTTFCAGVDRKQWLQFFVIIAIGFDKHCSSSFSQNSIFSKLLTANVSFLCYKSEWSDSDPVVHTSSSLEEIMSMLCVPRLHNSSIYALRLTLIVENCTRVTESRRNHFSTTLLYKILHPSNSLKKC